MYNTYIVNYFKIGIYIMLITLHCGGMPFNGSTIKNKSLGGSESAAYYMALELAKNPKNKVTIFTNTDDEQVFDDVRYVPIGKTSEQFPLGDLFHYYAENNPTDVMIIQRHPQAFSFPWLSKINLWWVHDLALIRTAPLVNDMLWNVDAVLTVSEWHKKQLMEVYNLNDRIVKVVRNGVDLSLFEDSLIPIPYILSTEHTNLIYTSRPERGLECLLKPGGIMDKLPPNEYVLYYCAYDNVTDVMKPFYDKLNEWGQRFDNVHNLGALTKEELAAVMKECDLHVYPSHFEETSCITAMECAAAGLPMIATRIGALPETVADCAVLLVDEPVDLTEFANEIINYDYTDSARKQKSAASYFKWSSDELTRVIDDCFNQSKTSMVTTTRHFIQHSDYYAARKCLNGKVPTDRVTADLLFSLMTELAECYKFTDNTDWSDYYKSYYEYEAGRGVVYGPEDLSNNHRFLHVAELIGKLPDGSRVLDYGCAHGHYTVNLAKMFPEIEFVGIDITQSNIDKAIDWASFEKLNNVTFRCDSVKDNTIDYNKSFECIIAAEILEHVENPQSIVTALSSKIVAFGGGLMIVTTPYGPWEAQGYKEHWPWRAHVHHFERDDLRDMWGHYKDFKIVNVPAGQGLGSYITTWTVTDLKDKKNRQIDYDRKLHLVAPTQTVSCCMIVKDSHESIIRCLKSVMPHVEQLCIAWDETDKTDSRVKVQDYISTRWPEKSFIDCVIKSPIESGFDTARNKSLKMAGCDWVLWVDADEVLHNGHNLVKYLKNNQYDGYALPQHHTSYEPVGLVRTDYPVKLFRNHKGVQFFGKVHEHPETQLNAGVGHVYQVNDVSVMHDGYTDESTRRGRYLRNIRLMERDRKEHPSRTLGKFLWLRDLAQSAQWDLEKTGGKITHSMVYKANEGVALWRELVDSGEMRLAVDGLDYYSALCRLIGNGFEMSFKLDTSKYGNANSDQVRDVSGYFANIDDAGYLINTVFSKRTEKYEGKYS